MYFVELFKIQSRGLSWCIFTLTFITGLSGSIYTHLYKWFIWMYLIELLKIQCVQVVEKYVCSIFVKVTVPVSKSDEC